MRLEKLPAKFSVPELEREIAKWWEEKQVLKRYLKKNKGASRRFSFLDGPITANNPMGVHHGWGRTLKDMYQRYKNMQGFEQRFQNGFDNQGLWVEVEVEKKLGFKNKKDIEEYGIDRFIEECKKHTLYFAQVQTQQSRRLGYFMDWDNSYFTMSEENNYAIWAFLKKCYEKRWIYKGEDVVPWCPRCGTAISQHEILTGDYATLTHNSLYVKYPLKGEEGGLLVWTTTPWTLPGNVAIAVNPKLSYLKVRTKEGEVFYIGEERAKEILGDDFEVLERVQGKELEGKEYEGLFSDLPIVQENKPEFKVVLWEEGVTEKEGTSLVHMSTGSGPEDYQYGREHGLAVFPVIDEDGRYVKGFGFLEGEYAHEVDEKIISYLKEKGALWRVEPYEHRYPKCWRCKTPLLFRLVDEWYISMDELRYQIMEVAKKVRWIPPFGLKMELDWLKNMRDWLISKKRYWGLTLPIWECHKCGHFEVIGSKEELKERAVEGWEEFEGHTPHKPWVDKVKIKCSKCGEIISRIPDVGNPWLDAGIVPYSTLHYFTNREYWQKWFPADLVLECFPGQFKNWFYSLLTMSTVLENTNPFKTLVGHALVKDEQGREMHKSWGNAIEFNEAAEKMGADVMRWMYVKQPIEIDLRFGFNVAEQNKREFFDLLWNSVRFFVEYAGLHLGSDIEEKELLEIRSQHILDKWILSRLNNILSLVTEKLEDFDHPKAFRELENFVREDLSLWYVRRSRERLAPYLSKEEVLPALATFYQVLHKLLRVLAIAIPYTTEKLWQALGHQDSVHLEDWPEIEKEAIDKDLEEKMGELRELVSEVHALRKTSQIKVRQPLQKALFKTDSDFSSQLLQIACQELNVKEIEAVKTLPSETEEWRVGERVALYIKITPELQKEGIIREIIRHIQQVRKELGLSPTQKIEIVLLGKEEEINELLQVKVGTIMQKTLAKAVYLNPQDWQDRITKEIDTPLGRVEIWIKRG